MAADMEEKRGTMYGLWSTAHSVGEFLTYVGTAALVAAVWMVWKDGSWNRGRVLPGLPGLESEPVLVVVVGDLRGVAQVRAGIDDERIVAESDDAFPLRRTSPLYFP